MRKCAKCKKYKSLKEFHKYYNKLRNKIYYRSYCKSCIKKVNNKAYNLDWYRKNYMKNKEKIDKRQKIHIQKLLKVWRCWLKKTYGYPIKCSLCKIKLYFGHKDKRKVPHFDHRRGKIEVIKYTPSSIFKLKMTKERQELFKSCHFGILCDKCNKGLPTDLKTRRLIAKNLIKYIKV